MLDNVSKLFGRVNPNLIIRDDVCNIPNAVYGGQLISLFGRFYVALGTSPTGRIYHTTLNKRSAKRFKDNIDRRIPIGSCCSSCFEGECSYLPEIMITALSDEECETLVKFRETLLEAQQLKDTRQYKTSIDFNLNFNNFNHLNTIKL